VVFSPRFDGRTYVLEYRTNLIGGATWTNLAGAAISDAGVERTVTDTNATEKAKFCRVRITLP
jgi:hypothetical protein